MRDRASAAELAFGELPRLNWIVAGGLAVIIVGVVWTRRDSRPLHDEPPSMTE